MLYSSQLAREVVHNETSYIYRGVLSRSPTATTFLVEDNNSRKGRGVVLKQFKRNETGERFFHIAQRAYSLLNQHADAVAAAHIPPVRSCENFFQVVDYYEGIDVQDRFDQLPFTIFEIRDLLVALLKNLACLTNAGLSHNDIKPANVVLTRPNGPFLAENVRPIDCDLMTPIDEPGSMEFAFGTPFFIAPENIPRSPRIHFLDCQFNKSRNVASKPHATSDYYSLALLGYALLPGNLQILTSSCVSPVASPAHILATKMRGAFFYDDVWRRFERKFLPSVSAQQRRTFRAVFHTIVELAKTDPAARPQTVEEIHQRLQDTGNLIEI